MQMKDTSREHLRPKVRARTISQRTWLAMAFAVFFVSSSVVLIQMRRPAVFQPSHWTRMAWWMSPLEFNAARGLAETSAQINDIAGFAMPGSRIWIAGGRGLLAYTEDQGRTWHKLEWDPATDSFSAGTAVGSRTPEPQSLPFQTPSRVEAAAEPQSAAPPQTSPYTQSKATISVPNLIGLDAKNALAVLDKVRLKEGKVIEQPSQTPPGTVVEQNPAAGASLPPGGLVDLIVSAGVKGDTGLSENKPAVKKPPAEAQPNPARKDSAVKDKEALKRPTPNQSRPSVSGPALLPDLVTIRFTSRPYPDIIASDDRVYLPDDKGEQWFARGTISAQEAAAIVPPVGYSRVDNKALQARGWLKGSEGWVGGANGLVFRTSDGGATWVPVTRSAALQQAADGGGIYWQWLPPWYYLCLIVSLVLTLPAVRTAPEENVVEESIDGMAISDRALEPGDPDALDLQSIALGLSRFLRNERTLPPLTVAINGAWGMGKSSLMNLLRSDLESYGFRPVWFNAWHHQKEEHLLAALLQAVRLQAVPAIFQRGSLQFRWRLLLRRLRRYWTTVLVGLTVLLFMIGLEHQLHVSRPEFARNLWQMVLGWLSVRQPSSEMAAETVHWASWAVGAAAVVSALWRGLKAFGANPASLLASVSPGNRFKYLDQQTSFRQKFAAEFQDVTKALGARSMPIFIDDLDRCLPENVRDVMEAINFLVSSGDCFVILGMARESVEVSIGLSFKDVAAEMSDDASPDKARQNRAEFARHYLDKLVNIEVPVPTPTSEQALKLFLPPETSASAQKPLAAVGARTLARWAIPIITALLLMAGAYSLGLYVANKLPESAPSQQQAAEQPSQPQVAGPTQPVTPKPSPTIPAEIRSGEAPQPSLWLQAWPLYLSLAFLLWIFWSVITRRPNLIVKDSPAFAAALKIWYPLVIAGQSADASTRRFTPRSAKRFMNRVRYIAMRQRATVEGESIASQLAEKQSSEGRIDQPDRKGLKIPESILVALAAIHQAQPDWLRIQERLQTASEKPGPNDLENVLQKAIRDHEKVFQNWNQVANYRSLFLALWPTLIR